MLLSAPQDAGGERLERYFLEPAWEVRFKRSGVKDVPYDDLDSQSYVDPTNQPYFEPTLELGSISGVEKGRFAVAVAPTSDQEVSVVYVAVASANGIELHQFTRTGGALADYSPTRTRPALIAPRLKDKTDLKPIDQLAPALAVYGEQEAVTDASGGKNGTSTIRSPHAGGSGDRRRPERGTRRLRLCPGFRRQCPKSRAGPAASDRC